MRQPVQVMPPAASAPQTTRPAGTPLLLWPHRRRERLALLAILVLALAIRLSLWSLPVHQPANDEVEYLTAARDLLAGHGWRFYEHYPWLRAPLYPLFLAASLALAGGDAHLASLPSVGLSVALVYLLFLIGQSVAAAAPWATSSAAGALPTRSATSVTRAGLLAALLGALLLTLATFASLWMAETLWNILFALALLLLLRWYRRPRLALALGAAVALGLATLTRSLPMLFVPAIALWMVLAPRVAVVGLRRSLGIRSLMSGNRKHVVHSGLFVVCFVLTLAPWTLRNWLAYGAFIPVETGLSYNLWAFSEPREDLGEIQARLSAIANPGERAAYAQRRGLERLREDPAILARKIWPNIQAIFRVKVIEDRFLRQNYYSDVGLPYLVASLLTDDLLFLLIVLAAVWGLGRAPLDGRLLLVLLWLAYVVVSLALTHAEGRYRHFLYPVLIPYAGAALARAGGRHVPARRRLSLAAASALALLILSLYPWSWAGENLARGCWQAVADWRTWRGDLVGARVAEERAVAIANSSDSWIRLALAHERLGQVEPALVAYRAALALHADYYPASVRQGALLRRIGRAEEARTAFRGKWISGETMRDWAWENLRDPAPPLIDVGDPLDTGFVTGVHDAERDGGVSVRWTDGEAVLRLAGGPARLLVLRVAAPRPAGAPPAEIELCREERRCLSLPAVADWRTYRLPLPPRQGAWRLLVRSTSFRPAEVGGAPDDTRRLGVLIDSAAALPLR